MVVYVVTRFDRYESNCDMLIGVYSSKALALQEVNTDYCNINNIKPEDFDGVVWSGNDGPAVEYYENIANDEQYWQVERCTVDKLFHG